VYIIAGKAPEQKRNGVTGMKQSASEQLSTFLILCLDTQNRGGAYNVATPG